MVPADKLRKIPRHMSVCVHILSAVKEHLQLQTFHRQAVDPFFINNEGVVAVPPSILIKGKGLNTDSVGPIHGSLGFDMAKLDHTHADPEVRKCQRFSHLHPGSLVEFSGICVSLYLAALRGNHPSGIRCRQHQTHGSAVGLLLHEIYRIRDFLIFVHDHFLCRNLPEIITGQLLQAIKQEMVLVVIALMKNVDGRILAPDPVTVYNNRIRRNHLRYTMRRFDMPFSALTITLCPIFPKGESVSFEEDHAVNPHVVIHRAVHDGKTHLFRQQLGFSLTWIGKRGRVIFLPHLFRDLIHFPIGGVRNEILIKRLVFLRIPIHCISQFLQIDGKFPLARLLAVGTVFLVRIFILPLRLRLFDSGEELLIILEFTPADDITFPDFGTAGCVQL